MTTPILKSDMKIYVSSYNGVLDEFAKQVDLATPLDADKLVMWQDCQGSWGKLAEYCKKFFPKPIFTMQHGRRASRDYYPPLNKPFNGDKFLAWGKWDYDNVKALGKEAEIVGCPLNSWIKPKVMHKEKVILFVPVNTGKEEPDNIEVYYELLKIKESKVQQGLRKHYEQLRGEWKNITKQKLCDSFTIVSKVLPWHDHKLYIDGIIKGYQESAKNNQMLFELLRNVDLVVGLDEGTTELFAIAHDVPVIIVDGFKYRWIEGQTEVPKTPGFRHVKLDQLAKAVEEELANPGRLTKERLQTAENEMSILSIHDPIKRLHEIIGTH